MEYWLKTYSLIRLFMGYSYYLDLEAAKIIEEILAEKAWKGELVTLDDLCSMIDGRNICIIGGGESAEFQIAAKECDSFIAADGAATLILKHSLQRPVVVVGDLDGSWHGYLWAQKSLGGKAKFVIHAHGDNIGALKTLVRRLRGVAGTVQVRPLGDYSLILGGFTDGDRCLFLALHCKPAELAFTGMDFASKTGWWSKPFLKANTPPWPTKKVKLYIAMHLFKLGLQYAENHGLRVKSL